MRVRLAKQLTELEKQFYGSSQAYDRAQQGGAEPLDQVRPGPGPDGWPPAEKGLAHARWAAACVSPWAGLWGC